MKARRCSPPYPCRHGGRLPPVFLPLREVSARELGVVCARWRLPLADASALGGAAGTAPAVVDKKNINALAAAFVAGMEAHNPGGEHSKEGMCSGVATNLSRSAELFGFA